MSRKILIASDHAGFELKRALMEALPQYVWEDLGPAHPKDKVDYPDFAESLAGKISSGRAEHGVLICGSGIGMSIAANKFPGVRAALVTNPVSARLAREHNNANVVCLGGRFVAREYAAEIVHAFLSTPYSEDPRHGRRIEKISEIEKAQGKKRG